MASRTINPTNANATASIPTGGIKTPGFGTIRYGIVGMLADGATDTDLFAFADAFNGWTFDKKGNVTKPGMRAQWSKGTLSECISILRKQYGYTVEKTANGYRLAPDPDKPATAKRKRAARAVRNLRAAASKLGMTVEPPRPPSEPYTEPSGESA